MVKLLIGITGSVASIKLAQLITELHKQFGQEPCEIRVISTERALHFVDQEALKSMDPGITDFYTDRDEWEASSSDIAMISCLNLVKMWKDRGDPVLHIELRKWADIMLIAPLDANTLAKVANGLADNLLTCTVRAWDLLKPLIFAPAMNTVMFQHPITEKQIKILENDFRFKQIAPISKVLVCGDTGLGAMAEPVTIAERVLSISQQVDSK